MDHMSKIIPAIMPKDLPDIDDHVYDVEGIRDGKLVLIVSNIDKNTCRIAYLSEQAIIFKDIDSKNLYKEFRHDTKLGELL